MEGNHDFHFHFRLLSLKRQSLVILNVSCRMASRHRIVRSQFSIFASFPSFIHHPLRDLSSSRRIFRLFLQKWHAIDGERQRGRRSCRSRWGSRFSFGYHPAIVLSHKPFFSVVKDPSSSRQFTNTLFPSVLLSNAPFSGWRIDDSF